MYALDYTDPGTPASDAKQQVSVEIDGLKVTVPDGTSVMRAASMLGNQIPKLCATGSLKAFGSCRLCLVEIDGRKGYPASCTTTVSEGMKVRTQSEKLDQLRRGVIELYLSDHPQDCSSGAGDHRCELHDMAEVVGVTESRYTLGAATAKTPAGILQQLPKGQTHLGSTKDASNPYFVFNADACIVCSRCVRACD